MSWMPCDRACCCFWRSLSSCAWAWAVSWLNRGYWESCCSSVSDSAGIVLKTESTRFPELMKTFDSKKIQKANCREKLSATVTEPNLTCAMLTGEERVGESCCGDCCSWSSEVRVSGTTGGCRRCAVAVMVAWEEVGIPGTQKEGGGEKAWVLVLSRFQSNVRKQANFSSGGTAVAVEKSLERQTLDKHYRDWQRWCRGGWGWWSGCPCCWTSWAGGRPRSRRGPAGWTAEEGTGCWSDREVNRRCCVQLEAPTDSAPGLVTGKCWEARVCKSDRRCTKTWLCSYTSNKQLT